MNVNVRLQQNAQVKSTVSNQPQVITVSTNTANRLSSLSDIDTSSLLHGALLQYDSGLNAWVASNIIERSGLIINCGNY
jgi:hypothetical protein